MLESLAKDNDRRVGEMGRVLLEAAVVGWYSRRRATDRHDSEDSEILLFKPHRLDK